jgi:hypothetical protein
MRAILDDTLMIDARAGVDNDVCSNACCWIDDSACYNYRADTEDTSDATVAAG